MTTFGPCLQSPRQSTESIRTSPFAPAARSSSLSALRTSLEPRFLQSPPPHTSTCASWSRIFAPGFALVARAPFVSARFFLAFFVLLEMASSSSGPGSRRVAPARWLPPGSSHRIGTLSLTENHSQLVAIYHLAGQGCIIGGAEVHELGRGRFDGRSAQAEPFGSVVIHKPGAIVARLQRPGVGAGPGRAAPAPGADPLRRHLGDQPRRVLHDPGRRAPAAGCLRAAEPGPRRDDP